MIGYRYDDGGRAASGRRGDAGDCVVRAMAILTGLPYGTCYGMLAGANREVERRMRGKGKPKRARRSARNGVHKKAYATVFAEAGLIKLPHESGERPTFSEVHAIHGDCIVTTAKHVCAIIDGELRDTHDCRMAGWWRDVPGLEEQGIREWVETERKAMSVWVKPPEPAGRTIATFTLPQAGGLTR